MIQLVESVKERGVITPATVRQKEDGRYELISGHRRKRACELAGFEALRCEVVDLDRDAATVLMVESNYQRSQILPSEKAFAYKIRLEALSRQGKRTDLTSDPVGGKWDGKETAQMIGEQSGDSQTQVRRYIRLTNLVPELLDLVDEGKIKMRPAVELSYLDEDSQRAVVDEIDLNQCTPSHDQTIRMRKFFTEGKLTPEVVSAIMSEENLENALETWNEKLAEIWQLITTTPQDFKGGGIWGVIVNINGAVQSIGLALLVLFFVAGMVKTCGSFTEVKKPEHALKLFVRFAIAKGAITYGMELMLALFNIVQGTISTIMGSAGFSTPQQTVLPPELITSVEECGFFESIPLWAVTLIGGLFITVMSFILIMIVYGRFFKLYMYTALAPIPLSTFAGEPSQNVGKSFIKSYCAVCLEGAVIVLSCIIFSLFASSPPVVNPDAAAVTQVWSYIGELLFNMLVLVGSVKMSDRIIREMMGL